MIIRNTRSVCPICLENIPARLIQEPDGSVFMEKSCPECGDFRTLIWRGKLDFASWIAAASPLKDSEGIRCPDNCGLCGDHLRGSCCVLLEVTKRCNLRCRFCFADAGREEEPSFDRLCEQIRDIASKGNKPMLQLSGGEPTLRDDLAGLIRTAKEAGIPYVQVNTNGIRLALEPHLASLLAGAGLDFVFLQFDGTDDGIYRFLRGRDLMRIKEKAIENSVKAGLGVTLVPTVVPGVNTECLGDIVKFAAERSPGVRGVHFQPVSYFGRTPDGFPPDGERCTLDELLYGLCEECGLETADFVPSRCDHPLCGFHGSFISEKGMLIPLTKGESVPRDTITSEENREFVARHWKRDRQNEPSSGRMPRETAEEDEDRPIPAGGRYSLRLGMEESGVSDMDTFLKKVRSQSFTLSSMPFQDAMNLDIERLRSCSLHVYSSGKLVPLCAEYLSAADGTKRGKEK
ncbi:MAG: radical SAM protein [Eubacteriales bacterium]|nr:radical SAM protein [Eubacteriales bacterium]